MCANHDSVSEAATGELQPAPVCPQDETENLECAGCGERVSAEHAVTLDNGDGACESCAHSCERCDGSFLADDLETVHIGRRRSQQWCEACRDHSFCCADCGDRYDDDCAGLGRNCLEETVCPLCAESYFRCEGCDNTCHNDDYGDDGYCESCSRDDENGPIHEYGYQPTAVYHGDDGKPCSRLDYGGLFFGVELEVEVSSRYDRTEKAEEAKDLLGDWCYLKHDGSLDDGFEIVSHPGTFRHHQTAWNAFFADRPKGLKSFDTTTCGLHIHVSRRPLTSLQISKIVCFACSEANAEFVKRVAGRGPNSFCKVQKKKLGTAHQDGSYDRYQAVNVSPSKTIEFRLFKGTLKRESFLRAIEFAHALVTYTAPAGRSMRESLDHKAFIRFVSENRKTYPNLHALCQAFVGNKETPEAE